MAGDDVGAQLPDEPGSPMLRPGLRVVRRDDAHLQVGLGPDRVVLPDHPGVRGIAAGARRGSRRPAGHRRGARRLRCAAPGRPARGLSGAAALRHRPRPPPPRRTPTTRSAPSRPWPGAARRPWRWTCPTGGGRRWRRWSPAAGWGSWTTGHRPGCGWSVEDRAGPDRDRPAGPGRRAAPAAELRRRPADARSLRGPGPDRVPALRGRPPGRARPAAAAGGGAVLPRRHRPGTARAVRPGAAGAGPGAGRSGSWSAGRRVGGPRCGRPACWSRRPWTCRGAAGPGTRTAAAAGATRWPSGDRLPGRPDGRAGLTSTRCRASPPSRAGVGGSTRRRRSADVRARPLWSTSASPRPPGAVRPQKSQVTMPPRYAHGASSRAAREPGTTSVVPGSRVARDQG